MLRRTLVPYNFIQQINPPLPALLQVAETCYRANPKLHLQHTTGIAVQYNVKYFLYQDAAVCKIHNLKAKLFLCS